MKTRTTILAAAFLAVAALAMAQKPKSKAEIEALQAIQKEQQGATDPSLPAAERQQHTLAVMTKADEFVKKFADTEFKTWAYTQAADAAERINDGSKTIIYSELAIESDPKAYHPMLMIAAELARSTRENDLDKEEKLAKAEKYAHQAMEIVPDAPKPNPQIPDPQWDEIKKEFVGDAHRDLGMIASVRKKYDVAIAEFKQAVEIPHEPDPATFVRLAAAYNDNKQPDEALAVLAKVPANPQLAAFVDKEKKRAEALKAAKK
jgi:tetratricopeptide (TPR) repeat protein